MTADREKLREDVARLMWTEPDPYGVADAAIALVWPAAMREAAESINLRISECHEDEVGPKAGLMRARNAILSLLSPDAEKEEGR